jgi:hypothetical protein
MPVQVLPAGAAAAPGPLATITELEDMLGTKRANPGTSERRLLELCLNGASTAVIGEVKRRFNATPVMPFATDEVPNPPAPDPITENVNTRGRLFVRIPDARELTEVRLDAATIAPAGPGNPAGYELFALEGEGGANGRQPAHAILLPRAGGWLELVGYFGFYPVPDDVTLGVLQWAARVYHERGARMADTISDPEGGAASYFRQIPAGIEAMLKRYRIPGL